MEGEKAIVLFVVFFVAVVAGLTVYYGMIDKALRQELYGGASG